MENKTPMKTLSDEQAAYLSVILPHLKKHVEGEVSMMKSAAKHPSADKDGIANKVAELDKDLVLVNGILEALK
jgi:hypothetical protein